MPMSFKNINLNQRHSSGIFLGEFDSKLNKTLMYTHKTLNNNVNSNRQLNQNLKNFSQTNLHPQNKNALLLNDPLSHIYETISVSSISTGNNHLNNQNRTMRNLYNQNGQFSMPPSVLHQHEFQPPSSVNQYIELDSQIVNAKNPSQIHHHHQQQQQQHLHHPNNNNEMMFFGYDSTNEHSTSSSTDYSSSQQSQDSYLKILPPSASSNFAILNNNNKSLINSFNLRNNSNHMNNNNKLSFINVSNQAAASPAASSSQSLLNASNVNEFDASMIHDFRQTNTRINHQLLQQQQQQNRFTNNNNKNDYLQPDVNVNFLNIHQLNSSKNGSNNNNSSNGNQAVFFTNRIEAVV
jgi:hypothetical protein